MAVKKYLPLSRISHPTNKQVTKRIVKFLQIVRDPATLRTTLKNAPDSVIKTICNIALNAQQGDVDIKPIHKKILQRHKKKIDTLLSKEKSIKTKRTLLQRGGFAFLPALLAAVLPTLGGLIFEKLIK